LRDFILRGAHRSRAEKERGAADKIKERIKVPFEGIFKRRRPHSYTVLSKNSSETKRTEAQEL
jgi:hypothetical protein